MRLVIEGMERLLREPMRHCQKPSPERVNGLKIC